jgi:hypothetical protein
MTAIVVIFVIALPAIAMDVMWCAGFSATSTSVFLPDEYRVETRT